MDNYFDTGLAHLENDEYPEAISAFTKALRLALGDLAEILMYRGVAYAYTGDFVRAHADLLESLTQNPHYPEAYNERGNVYRMQRAYRDALQDYSSALMLDENFVEARYNRGLCYEELGMYSEAERDLTLVIQHNPGIAPAHEARGRVRALMRRYDDAIADYQRYLRMGGGREYDNHSEVQATIITLRLQKWLRRLLRLG
mgnify:CR=1 FL=1|jgi:tetratricopeptide (TPR) repeat protein